MASSTDIVQTTSPPAETSNDSKKPKENSLVVISRIRATIKAMELNCSESAIEAVNELVLELCRRAGANAKTNKRKTIKKDDFGDYFINEFMEGEDILCSTEEAEAFKQKCGGLAKSACDRARANKRKRLIAEDF